MIIALMCISTCTVFMVQASEHKIHRLKPAATTEVRKPAVAGAFYPGSAHQLTEMIEKYLMNVGSQEIGGDIQVLISPHAGYIYSGQVAAYGYELLKGKTFDAIIVLGPSHFVPFNGVSIFQGTAYETPLGTVPINQEIVKKLRMSPFVGYYAQAHQKEHSLELQLPFLQQVIGEFSLVPLVCGDFTFETADEISRILADIAKEKNILVIASTDLSHFKPYRAANVMDKKTIDEMMKLSGRGMYEFFMNNSEAACGKMPVVTALLFAEKIGAGKGTVLKYLNSGDTAGNKSSVVGYVSIAIAKGGNEEMEKESRDEGTLAQKSKEELFSIVRNTIKEYLSGKKISHLETSNHEIQKENGVFVTLHSKSGALRGCIGCFVSNEPLYKTVQEFAVSSAFRDPRFPPVTLAEIDDLVVEISVLSPMKKIDDPGEIELGKHGIYIKKGFKSGTFLPQVATDTGWSLEEFLGHCARDKAGIGWDGWKDADLFIYTAEVFGENDHS